MQDAAALQSIIDFGAPTSGETIVEIGPGLGALTTALARRSPDLTLIEIEGSFAEDLAQRYPSARVICADVRQVDFSTLGQSLVIYGNLPYAFSTEIVFHLIESAAVLSRAVLLLQREFVERMCAEPGGRDYGTLSIGCQLWSELRMGPVVSGECFYPRASVESRVVELKFLKTPRVQIGDAAFFRKVVKASFSQRRRKLINSLKGSGIADQEILSEALRLSAIDPGRRAETLSLAEFAALTANMRRLIHGQP